jgi:hypothetical protein
MGAQLGSRGRVMAVSVGSIANETINGHNAPQLGSGDYPSNAREKKCYLRVPIAIAIPRSLIFHEISFPAIARRDNPFPGGEYVF